MRNDQHALGRKLVKVGIAALILTCSSTQAMPNQQETKNNQLCSPSHIMSDGYDWGTYYPRPQKNPRAPK